MLSRSRLFRCKVDLSGCKVDHQSFLLSRENTNLTPTSFPLHLLVSNVCFNRLTCAINFNFNVNILWKYLYLYINKMRIYIIMFVSLLFCLYIYLFICHFQLWHLNNICHDCSENLDNKRFRIIKFKNSYNVVRSI